MIEVSNCMMNVIKNPKNKWKLNSQGFTLVEVLAAFLLLLMISQMLLLGISFCAKVEKRTEQMEWLRRGIGEHLAEQEDCISGTVRLKMDETDADIVEWGLLYTGSEDNEQPINLQIIWVDEVDAAAVEDMLEE